MLEISISQPASHEFAISNEYYLFALIVKRNVLRFDFPFFFNLFFFLAFLRTLRSTCEARHSLENISRKRAVQLACYIGPCNPFDAYQTLYMRMSKSAQK